MNLEILVLFTLHIEFRDCQKLVYMVLLRSGYSNDTVWKCQPPKRQFEMWLKLMNIIVRNYKNGFQKSVLNNASNQDSHRSIILKSKLKGVGHLLTKWTFLR